MYRMKRLRGLATVAIVASMLILPGAKIKAFAETTATTEATNAESVAATSSANSISESNAIAQPFTDETSSDTEKTSASMTDETSESVNESSSSSQTSTSSSTKSAKKLQTRAVAADDASVTAEKTGVLGTVHWSLENGVLTLSGGSFENSLQAYNNVSPWTDIKDQVKSINISGKITADYGADYSYLFALFGALQSVKNMNNLDLSNVTNVFMMFWLDNALTSIDVSDAQVGNVTNMGGMFSTCGSLTSLDVSNWDTSSVINFDNLFFNCTKLVNPNVSNWDVSRGTSFKGMFSYNKGLTSLDISGWHMSSSAVLTGMLTSTSNLSHLKLGTNTRLATVGLPEVPSTGTNYNGTWMTPQGNTTYTSTQLMANYDGSTMAGDYYWASDAMGIVRYVDVDGNPVADNTMIYGVVGGSYTTTPLEVSGYQLISTPDNAKGTYQAGKTVEVTYIYAPLGPTFTSVLTDFDFGLRKISSEDQTYSLNAKTGDLKVQSYGSKGWSLSAQLTKPFTGVDTGAVLNATLLYQDAAGQQTAIGTSQPAQLITNSTTGSNEVNVSSNWLPNSTEGLKLKVPGNAVPRLDNYEAEVTWGLTDGVSND